MGRWKWEDGSREAYNTPILDFETWSMREFPSKGGVAKIFEENF